MRRLIITADDFGLDEGVNRAILEGHRAGVITSASLMMNMEGLDDALSRARSAPALAVGLHLVLAAGRPLMSPWRVPSLVDHQGRFLRRRELAWRLALGKVSPSELEAELRAQVERAQAMNLHPSFINGDQHVHVLPGVREVVLRLARELGVPVRGPKERLEWRGGLPGIRDLKVLAAKVGLRRLAGTFERKCRDQEVATNDHFMSLFGLLPRRSPAPADFLRLLSTVGDGLTELMVHPAYFSTDLAAFWVGGEAQAREREMELGALLHDGVRKALSNSGIVLSKWGSRLAVGEPR